MIWGAVGGTEELDDAHMQAMSEVAQWVYRKALKLSFEEFLNEPLTKYLYGLQIESSIGRLKASKNGG